MFKSPPLREFWRPYYPSNESRADGGNDDPFG